tara:strand:+ start:299 stop:712 length:414 start_codon:yes stop_codon:yes gene_type:complete
MGINYLDEYSLSHFVGGIILHHMNIPRLVSYGLHIIFEIFENYIYVPYFGGRCIRIEYLLPIMDCKTVPDTTKNILGDQVCFMLGYEFSNLLKYPKLKLSKYSWILIPILPLILSMITTNIIGKTPSYEFKNHHHQM